MRAFSSKYGLEDVGEEGFRGETIWFWLNSGNDTVPFVFQYVVMLGQYVIII